MAFTLPVCTSVELHWWYRVPRIFYRSGFAPFPIFIDFFKFSELSVLWLTQTSRRQRLGVARALAPTKRGMNNVLSPVSRSQSAPEGALDGDLRAARASLAAGLS